MLWCNLGQTFPAVIEPVDGWREPGLPAEGQGRIAKEGTGSLEAPESDARSELSRVLRAREPGMLLGLRGLE